MSDEQLKNLDNTRLCFMLLFGLHKEKKNIEYRTPNIEVSESLPVSRKGLV